MDPTFRLFSSFSQYIDKYSAKFEYNLKKFRCCAWDSNPNLGIKGTNESTELWWPQRLHSYLTIVQNTTVAVAQLVKQSLPMPEVRGLNPVIGKLLYLTFSCLPTVNCIEKTKIKAGNGHFLKKLFRCEQSNVGRN